MRASRNLYPGLCYWENSGFGPANFPQPGWFPLQKVTGTEKCHMSGGPRGAALLAALRSASCDARELQSSMSTIIASPYPQFTFLSMLNGRGRPFLRATDRDLRGLPPDYRVPCRLSFRRRRPPAPCAASRLHGEFASLPGNSVTRQEFAGYLTSHVGQSAAAEFAADSDLLWDTLPLSVLLSVSNPVSGGVVSAVQHDSYRKVSYPASPSSSGDSARE
jgi:hypothetical protein